MISSQFAEIWHQPIYDRRHNKPLVSLVAADAMVLKHQAINSPNTDVMAVI